MGRMILDSRRTILDRLVEAFSAHLLSQRRLFPPQIGAIASLLDPPVQLGVDGNPSTESQKYLYLLSSFLSLSDSRSSNLHLNDMASTSTEDNKPRMYKLRCFDGTELEISEAAVMLSETLKVAINSDFDELSVIPIPIQDLTAHILEKVISYCTKHAEFAAALAEEVDIKAWDKEFINVSVDTLYDLLVASNYLEVKGLLELSTDKVANLIRGKTVEEIRATFNIVNDFTPEEEAEVRGEFPWAFQ